MHIKYLGIITGGAHAQSHINSDHARDIGNALSKKYEVSYFDLSKTEDLDRLITERRNKKLDVVFNNAAGKQGGDGTVEGFLELLSIPFIGSDTLATAVAFDKKTTKTIVKAAGVPIIRGMTVTEKEFLEEPEETYAHLLRRIRLPLIIKASQGSDSIGVSLVKEEKEIIPAIRLALKEDDTLIIEDFIRRQAEITCMVIGNGDDAKALEPVERVYDTEILYPDAKRTYRHPELKSDILDHIKKYSVKAHRAVGCADYSRSDFLVGKKGSIYFLELNAHAGLGNVGPTAFATKHTLNWTYDDMIHQILETAIKRFEKFK
jgi:D-alanine-D-alanine ligase